MSNDQLSWDQLFNNTAEDAKASKSSSDSKAADAPGSTKKKRSSGKQAEVSADPSDDPKPGKKSSRKSPKSEPTTVAEPTDSQTHYSKKNWSKLEFPNMAEPKSTETQAPAAASTTTSVKVETTEVEVSQQTAKVTTTQVTQVTTAAKAVKIPVIMDPTEDPFGEEEEQKKPEEPKVLSVSDLNKHIRGILEGRFSMIWIKGEISNFKAHTSGHFYFSLKDSKAQVNAVMFRGFNAQLRFRPEDGMEVLVRGKVTVYEPRGNYQVFCEMMEPVGAGALQKAFEQLKAKLQKEGLFDEARKRPLPSLPKHIAIVTSPTGAAIRDMLNVLGRRFKGVNITVVPCKVQGDQAPSEIVAAIGLANRLADVDVMIVGRGGGSIEDLWAFNDERVARAISAARVPVISAVGHEVDFTIADFVADLRAPTPSAAAELVVKNAADLAERVAGLARALRLDVLSFLNSARQNVTQLSKRLVDPQRRLQDASQRCDELLQRLELAALRNFQNGQLKIQLLEQRLGTPLERVGRERQFVQSLDLRLRGAVQNRLLRKRETLAKNAAVLDSLSPLKVLDRGYSMVVRGEEIVTAATSLKPGDTVTVRMCKGSIEAQVTKIEEKKR